MCQLLHQLIYRKVESGHLVTSLAGAPYIWPTAEWSLEQWGCIFLLL